MKKKMVLLVMISYAFSFASAGYIGNVLFSDSYDRPNNTSV